MDKEEKITGRAGTEKVFWDETGQVELACGNRERLNA